jgi:hypothetical protein
MPTEPGLPPHDGRPPYFMPDVIAEAHRLSALYEGCTAHEIAQAVARHVYEDLMLELVGPVPDYVPDFPDVGPVPGFDCPDF